MDKLRCQLKKIKIRETADDTFFTLKSCSKVEIVRLNLRQIHQISKRFSPKIQKKYVRKVYVVPFYLFCPGDLVIRESWHRCDRMYSFGPFQSQASDSRLTQTLHIVRYHGW